MFLKTKKSIIIVTMAFLSVIGFVACQPKLAPQNDCNFVMSAQIQRVSWKNNLPVKLYISSGIPQELRESIRVAASQWNAAIGITAIMIMESDSTPVNPAQDGINAIYWQTTWDASRPDEQARTTIHWRGDVINEADILVNAKDHEYSAFAEITTTKIDFTSLMVHEMGHVLGLQHIQGQSSVMNPTLGIGSNNERIVPFDVDKKSVKCEYN